MENNNYNQNSNKRGKTLVNIIVENNENRNKKGSSIFFGALCFAAALLMVANIYMKFIIFNPSDPDILDDNLFSGNSITISEDEQNRIMADLEEEFGIDVCEGYEDEYCLLNAIMTNPDLNDSEKQCFSKCIEVVKDNPYLNKEAAYKALLNVDVCYKKRPYWLENDVKGIYVPDKHCIGIFDGGEDNMVLSHELIHCLFSSEQTAKLPEYFKEGMTQLLTKEYFSEHPFVEITTYPFEVLAVKMLCDVTSADTVLKAYSLGDMSIIAEEIAKVTGDLDSATKSLDMLEYTMRFFNNDLEEDEITITNREEILSTFMPTFINCVDSKYSRDDIAHKAFYYNVLYFANIFNEDPYNDYVRTIEEYGGIKRAYFSSELKEQYPEFSMKNDDGVQSLSIPKTYKFIKKM